jgi:dTDP-4-dehydrorhamnose reductase
MRIILLGSSGQLGYEFKQFLKDKVELFSFSHKELDILDYDSLENKFQEIKPCIVINCAAYTKVDTAEDEKDLSFKINAVGAKNVSFTAYNANAKVVYFSTDYIFDGKKKSPYTEFDEPNPISVYGNSKLYGEQFTKEFNPGHLILRISWLYGINGNNFVKTIINLAKTRKEIKVVNDQYGTPTYTLDVVNQVWKLIQKDAVGTYHCTNEGYTTWFEFAEEIISLLNLNVKVIPIASKDYPTPAERPQYSILENYLLKLEKLNIMRPWKIALKDFIAKYKKELLSTK